MTGIHRGHEQRGEPANAYQILAFGVSAVCALILVWALTPWFPWN